MGPISKVSLNRRFKIMFALLVAGFLFTALFFLIVGQFWGTGINLFFAMLTGHVGYKLLPKLLATELAKNILGDRISRVVDQPVQ